MYSSTLKYLFPVLFVSDLFTGFFVLPSVIESLPISMEDGKRGQQQTNGFGDQESQELAGQTDGAEQTGGSSEEVGAGNTWPSVGVIPVNPGPVNPVGPGREGGAPAAIPRYHSVAVPKYPDIGPADPVGNPRIPPVIPPPAPTEWPAAIPLTTRTRGDIGMEAFNPRMNGAGFKPPKQDVRPKSKSPTISNNIAHISQDEPKAPRTQPVPFPAILAVVVIGGVVVVTAIGGVAYFVATRVRIS